MYNWKTSSCCINQTERWHLCNKQLYSHNLSQLTAGFVVRLPSAFNFSSEVIHWINEVPKRPCACASAVPWGSPWVTEINNILLTEINSSKLILPFPVVVRLWMSSLALYPGRGRLAAFNTSVKSLVSMKPFPLISAKVKANFYILHQPNDIFCT